MTYSAERHALSTDQLIYGHQPCVDTDLLSGCEDEWLSTHLSSHVTLSVTLHDIVCHIRAQTNYDPPAS